MDYEQNAHLAAAPAYALESDSESDWDDDELPRPHSTAAKELAPDAAVTLEGSVEGLSKGREAVFLLGEAGERLAQGVRLDDDAASLRAIKVVVDGEQVGLVLPATSDAQPSLVFLSTALPLASLHPLASTLLERLEPSVVTIVSSYHLASYIPPSQSAASTSTAPILSLSSPFPSPAVTQLRSTGSLQPFTTPNLHHGLASSLLALSHLSPSTSSATLLLLPTTTPPQPLNGPFSLASPVSAAGGSAGTLYDAGGPTGMSDPGALFRELAGIAGRAGARPASTARTRRAGPLRQVKAALAWEWWNPDGQGGKGFEWLERQRRDKRREQAGSMYM